LTTDRRFPACVLATVVVPWTEEYQLDEGLFRHEIAALLGAGLRNLYVFGTAGEGYAVSDARFQSIARVYVEEMRAGGAEPMVGIISLSLETLLERIAHARDELGVRLFQISLPSWGALESDEVRTFFDRVLGQFEDCQFLHYNLLRSKRLVTAAEYAAMAAEHPNLVATKNSTDSITRIRELIDDAPMLQHFLNERGYAYGSLIGECGLLASISTVSWRMTLRYFEAGQHRDIEGLMRMEGDVSEIAAALLQHIGPGHIDGAYDKVLYWLHADRFPLRLLPPYTGAEVEQAKQFRDWLRRYYPDWAL
jgi:dihydrodipicolinate synthase/N-acetylneuraminate lyase